MARVIRDCQDVQLYAVLQALERIAYDSRSIGETGATLDEGLRCYRWDRTRLESAAEPSSAYDI